LPKTGARAADFNQAMMDLGALLCTRVHPRCAKCPLVGGCQGHASGTPERFPGRRLQGTRPARQITMLILIDPAGRVLLERRPAKGIWGGLWSFPECPVEADPTAWCHKEFGVASRPLMPLLAMQHGFTHFTLTIYPQLLRISRSAGARIGSDGLDWILPGVAPRRGLATPVKRLLKQLESVL